MSRFLTISCYLLLVSGVLADDAAPQATPDKGALLQQADQLRQAATPFKQQEAAARDAETKLQQQVLELQQALLKLQRELEAVQKSVTESEAKLKTEQEAAAKTEAEKKQADQVYTDATKALAEAQKKSDEAKAAAEAAAKKDQDARNVVAATTEALNGMKAKTTELGGSLEQSRQQVAAVQQQQTASLASAEVAYKEWLTREQQAEQLLTQAGEWVSFSNEVAPIFYNRCLACHNARTAKGRYNMENFAAIMKGGESGAVLEGKSSDALLCTMLADGSMPKEADPLTPEQIALVSRWVDLGTRLDAGVDPLAALIKIMPKQPQPAPPESYRVPIPVTALAFSPDGTLLATSGYHEVLLWNVESGTLVRRIQNVAERTYSVAFSADGSRLAIATGTPGQIGEVKIFQTADGQLLGDLVTVEDAMFCVTFSPDGNRLAACGADRSIRLFDAANGAEQRLIEDHADWVSSIAWSPDGSKLVSASRDKTCKVFDANTGDALTTFNGHGEVVSGAAFLADGNSIISGGRDKQLRVWQTADAKEVRKIGGFGDDITHVIMLPDNRVLTSCADKSARLHNANDGAALKTYAGSPDWLHCAAVHVASGKVATGCFNGEVRLYNLEDAAAVRDWVAKP